MKYQDAIDLIGGDYSGYMVHFEWIEGGMLRGDYFPDKHAGEELIESMAEAWDLAKKFAAKTKGKTCNLYVIDKNFSPVVNYKAHLIANR